jgi:hypothetical protein
MIRKSIALLGVALMLSASLYAQNARETTAKFKDNPQAAVTADYLADEDFVKEALKEKLAKEGFGKKSSESGYDAYKATNWGRVSSEKLDVYIKVDGRKGKSTVTILAAKGYDNFVSGSKDASLIGKVQEFLNSFNGYVKAKRSLIAQEELVKEMDEENKKMLKEKEELEKKIVEFNTTLTQKQALINTEKLKIEEIKKGL